MLVATIFSSFLTIMMAANMVTHQANFEQKLKDIFRSSRAARTLFPFRARTRHISRGNECWVTTLHENAIAG